MNRLNRAIVTTFALCAAFTLGFASSAQAQTAAPDTARPVVFAAASMKTALDAVNAKWQAETGKSVAVSYAASSVLARQIEQGAPAEIFISADLDWMNWLQERKLIKNETRQSLLGNALVLVAPRTSPQPFTLTQGANLSGATGDGKIAVCTIASCPAGKYAREAFEHLGMWATVEAKLAQADNVRAALALVARGEARYGVVYATDAKAEPNVIVVGIFPEDSHPPVIYPIALTATSNKPDAAAFLAYMRSPTATAIFLEQGFTVLPEKR